MIELIAAGLIVGMLVTGFVRLKKDQKDLSNNIVRVNEFRNKFIQLANKYFQDRSINNKLYHWLTSNSFEIQTELGMFGVADYISPFGKFRAKNYQYILNTLPQIRTGEVHEADVLYCDDMMVRYTGYMQMLEKERTKQLRNPFIWFQYGVRFYISLPLQLFTWFGIISDTFLTAVTLSPVFKVISGIVSLVSLLGTIITISLGWEGFKSLLLSWVN